MADDLKPGDGVTWAHEMRGGYGYIERIPGRLLEVRGERAKIKVHKVDGEVVTRWVKLANLTRRTG